MAFAHPWSTQWRPVIGRIAITISSKMCVCKICLMLSDQTIFPCLFAALSFIELNLKQCLVLPVAQIRCILKDVTKVLVIKKNGLMLRMFGHSPFLAIYTVSCN